MTGKEARKMIDNDQRYNFMPDSHLHHIILLGLGLTVKLPKT